MKKWSLEELTALMKECFVPDWRVAREFGQEFLDYLKEKERGEAEEVPND